MRTPTRWWAYTLLALAAASPTPVWPQPAQADEVVLPAPVTDGQMSLEAAIAGRRSVREFSDTTLTWQEIGQLAWAAQGITDPERGLRAAPSAGALYPLELYLVTPDGLYHYVPVGHKLQRLPLADALGTFRAVTGNQPSIQQAPLTIIITAAFERVRERFGERADGFIYLEAGHVGQNLQLQARALGLGSLPVGGFDPARVAEALALPGDHVPVYVMPSGHPRTATDTP
jgi:SagB-type dehydrogenase family enzyme